MQELINQVREQAGVTEEQAVKAIDAVKNFVKSKLPPMLASNVDTWFDGLSGQASQKPQDDFLD